MKNVVNTMLFGVVFSALSNVAIADDANVDITLDVNKELNKLVSVSINALETPNASELAKAELAKSSLESQASILLADAKQDLPKNRFKVVIAD